MERRDGKVKGIEAIPRLGAEDCVTAFGVARVMCSASVCAFPFP